MIKYLRTGGKFYKEIEGERFEITGQEHAKATGVSLQKPKPIKLNLRLFMLQLLGTPLFDELNTYLKDYPTLVAFTEDGILTQDEVTKLLEHLDLHLAGEVVSQDLYNVIKGALTNEG